jgi:AraC-like DNA-binding protein
VPFGHRVDEKGRLVPDRRRDKARKLSPADVLRAIQLLAAAGLSSPQLSRIFRPFGLSARRIRRLTAKRLGADEAVWQRIQKMKAINSKRGKPFIAAPWHFLQDLARRVSRAARAIFELLLRYLGWTPPALPYVLALITMHLAQRPPDHTLHPPRGWGTDPPMQLAPSTQLGGRPEHLGRRVHYLFARHCGISLRDGTDGLSSEPAVNSRPSIGTGHPFVSPGQRRALQGEDLRLPDANWDYLAPPRGQGPTDRGLTIRSWGRHIPAAGRKPTRRRHRSADRVRSRDCGHH